jgi:hypothetical protein
MRGSSPGRGWEFFFSNAEFKEYLYLYLHSPSTSSWRGAYLSTGTLPSCPERLWGATQTTIQWVTESVSVEVKRLGREADFPPPSNAKVKNAWSYNSTPSVRLHGMVLS